jgi:hypothetical protein
MSSELNWRFKREFLKEENAQEKNELFQTFEDLHEKINKLDSHEKELVEPSLKRVKDVFDIDLGSDLKMFSFNAYQPYSTAWLGHLTSQNQGVPVMNFGSGISMLLAISLSLSFAEESKSPFIVLIDEPELPLHGNTRSTSGLRAGGFGAGRYASSASRTTSLRVGPRRGVARPAGTSSSRARLPRTSLSRPAVRSGAK